MLTLSANFELLLCFSNFDLVKDRNVYVSSLSAKRDFPCNWRPLYSKCVCCLLIFCKVTLNTYLYSKTVYCLNSETSLCGIVFLPMHIRTQNSLIEIHLKQLVIKLRLTYINKTALSSMSISSNVFKVQLT